MSMTIEDKRKAIELLVQDVFMPEHNLLLAQFLVDYGNSLKQSTLLSMQLGVQVGLPPVHFDLRVPTTKLINNLVEIEVLFNKENPK